MPEDILSQLANDENTRDDDHLDRPELTDKEKTLLSKQFLEKHKHRKPVDDKDPHRFAKATIEALNNQKDQY